MRTLGITVWLLSLSLWILVLDVQAQGTGEGAPRTELNYQDYDDLELEDLLDMTISIAAGRSQTLEEAPSIVFVITAEDIRRMGARTLDEVLRIVPGFEVVTDSMGRVLIVARGIRLTGSSENVLVLFNGHRLNEELNGGALIINPEIPVDNIKQIEIIRGPGSAIFGANAFLGVINIVTYAAEDLDGVRISGGGGSFHSQQYNLQFGHAFNDLSLSGFVQYADTDGPQLPVAADFQTYIDFILALQGIPAVSRAPGHTVDDYTTVDANLQATYKGLTLNGRIKDETTGGYIGNIDILGDSWFDYRQISFDAGYQRTLGEQGRLLGKFNFTQNMIREFNDFFPPGMAIPKPDGTIMLCPDGVLFEYATNFRRLGGEAQLHYPVFENNQLTLGVSFEREAVFEQEAWANFDAFTLTPLPSFQRMPYTVIPEDTSRNIVGGFVQDIWNPLPELGLTLGARYDHYSDFGETFTPRAGMVWHIARDFNLKLLYGSAFRAPSFFELFYTVPHILQGNPALKPSTIQTFEAALGYKFRKNVRININYFRNAIQDLIVPAGGFSAAPSLVELPSSPITYVNRTDIDAQGVELEANVNLYRNISGFVNYVYQYPKDTTTGKQLHNIPLHIGNIGITIEIGTHVSLTPTLLLRGSQYRAATDPREDVPGYALLNLNMHLKNLFKTLEIMATINNVFDTRYVTPASVSMPGDFPRPGRSVFLKATYQF